jgi:hypothetical protein
LLKQSLRAYYSGIPGYQQMRPFMRYILQSASLSRCVLVSLCLVVFLVGCRQSQQTPQADPESVIISVEAVPQTPVVGEAELQIKLSDQAGQPIAGAKVDVRGDMTHAGMEPVFASADSGTDGIYTVPFEWTMAGDWIVSVTVTQPNQGLITKTFDFSVANP